MKKYLLIFAVITAFLVSCSKEDNLEKDNSSISKITLSVDQIEMLERMKETSLILTKIANDDDINSELAEFIKEKNYKDDFILFKDLFAESLGENLKSGNSRISLFEKAFDQVRKTSMLKSSGLDDLKKYLLDNNLALYIPYPLEDYPERYRVPTISYHPLDNEYSNEGFEPVVVDGQILSYNIVTVNEEYSLTHPVYLVIPKEEDDLYCNVKEKASSFIHGTNMKSALVNTVNASDDYIAIELKEYYVANNHQYDGIFAGPSELRIVLVGLTPLTDDTVTPEGIWIDCETSRENIRKGTVISMGTALKTDWEKELKTITVGAYDHDDGYWDISDGRVGFSYLVDNGLTAFVNWKDTTGTVGLVDTLTARTMATIGGTFRCKLESHDDICGVQEWGRNWIGQWTNGEKDYSFGDLKCTFEAISYNN